MEKAENANFPTSLKDELLYGNRFRCCVCRNPANPVQILSINTDTREYDSGRLVVVCDDCYELAVRCKQDFGEDYLRTELYQYKQVWEQECLAWRNSPDFSIKISDGEITNDSHNCDMVMLDSYRLREGEELPIDFTSDELVNIRVLKETAGYLGVREHIKCEDAHEFNLVFTAPKKGYYAVFIEKKSNEKTTITLKWPPRHSLRQKAAIERSLTRKSTDANPLQEKLTSAASAEVVSVSWRILPPGEHPFPRILEHFAYLKQSKRNLCIIEERIGLIASLKPTNTFLGIGGFKGYVIFYFEKPGIAILDCPVFGNAVYLIRGNWQVLSRLSKRDLLDQHTENVTRLVHRGDWFNRLEGVIQSSTALSITHRLLRSRDHLYHRIDRLTTKP